MLRGQGEVASDISITFQLNEPKHLCIEDEIRLSKARSASREPETYKSTQFQDNEALYRNASDAMENGVEGCARTEGGYGPGSWVDAFYTPVPEECKRVLEMLVQEAPGFPKDHRLLDSVTFEGGDLSCIPGPLKSQVLTAVMHAMAGIVGHEILAIRGHPTDGKTHIDTDMGGLYPGTPALVTVDGLDGPEVLHLPTLPHLCPPPSSGIDMDYDHFMVGGELKLRAMVIYPTKTQNVWFQLHGSTNPYAALSALGISKEVVDADAQKNLTRDEAYEFIKKRTMEHEAKELELIMIEQSKSRHTRIGIDH